MIQNTPAGRAWICAAARQLAADAARSADTHLMRLAQRHRSIASLICDGGDRYAETIYDSAWRAAQHLDLAEWIQPLRDYDATDRFDCGTGGNDRRADCDRDAGFDDVEFPI